MKRGSEPHHCLNYQPKNYRDSTSYPVYCITLSTTTPPERTLAEYIHINTCGSCLGKIAKAPLFTYILVILSGSLTDSSSWSGIASSYRFGNQYRIIYGTNAKNTIPFIALLGIFFKIYTIFYLKIWTE
jgi:hypothetical protein